MKQKNMDKSIFDIIENKPKDKANTVFLKLLAKRRGKYEGWSDVRAETLPSDKTDIRNEIEVE